MKLTSIECIARALNEAGVPFIVVGGLAVVAHGYGRQTQDIDLVLRLEPNAIRAAFQALTTLGYRPRVPVTADAFADAQQRARWVVEKGMTVLSFHSNNTAKRPWTYSSRNPSTLKRNTRHRPWRKSRLVFRCALCAWRR